MLLDRLALRELIVLRAMLKPVPPFPKRLRAENALVIVPILLSVGAILAEAALVALLVAL